MSTTLTVLEYSGRDLAASYAGSLLAKMGATVTAVDAPSSEPHDATGPLALARLALREKKSAITLPDERGALEVLLGTFDIVLTDAPAQFFATFGSVEAILARFPALTLGVASTFGLNGPYANFAGTGLDAQALSAISWCLGEQGRPPLSFPPGVLEHQAGALLAAGSLLSAMLHEEAPQANSDLAPDLEPDVARNQSSQGRLVDVALTDVLASYVAGNCRFMIHHGLEWKRSGRRASGSGGAYPFVILPCKDGEVCICGRTRQEWERFVVAMGNPAWAQEPRYQRLRAMGQEYPDEVDTLVLPWLATQSKEDIEALALEHNLILSPLREFEEVAATPQFSLDGYFADRSLQGKPVRTPTLPFRAREARSEQAPDIATGLLFADRPSPVAAGAHDQTTPLKGLRVLDLGWVWSAPWVGTFLAELGAEVIKVENANRPDNLRLAGRILRDGLLVEGPSREMSPMYHQVNHGKLGVSLDLKSPRARELLGQLVGMSDIVIENMSPGSLERIDLGYDAFKKINPRIVMLSMSAAGQFGPLSTMRAYAPTMSSFVGLEGLIGYRGEERLGALNFGLSDPSASVHGLVPLLAALRRARRTGQGCYVDLSQAEALLSTLLPYFLDAQVNGPGAPTLGNAHPDMAPHGIYPAAGDDAWVTLAVTDSDGWTRLTALASGEPWANHAKYNRLEGRLNDATALDEAIASWTAQHSRDALVAMLRGAGLAASPVLSIEEMWQDPHLGARGLKASITIPHYGPEEVFAAPWQFSDFSPAISKPGPGTGEHNSYILGSLLGLTPSEIDALGAEGVLG